MLEPRKASGERLRSGALRAAAAFAAAAALAVSAWAAGSFDDDSDANFDAGAPSAAYRRGTGSAATVELDFAGRAAGVSPAAGAGWYDANWQYRRPLTVNSTNGSALSSYQVLFSLDTSALIAAGRMRSDGGDLRFTTADGRTLASYYVESGMNTSATKVWVKVPSIAASADTTVYMYYGNASTTTASSLQNTFVFGDDFTGADGSALDSSKWVDIFASSTTTSLREIRSNQLHYSYGSYSANGWFGERSANTFSYASGRRYRVLIDATTIGAGQKSAINLCDLNSECISKLGFSGNWLAFEFTHSNPAYKLEKPNGTGITTIVGNTNTSTGLHQVEYLMSPGAYQVNLDGALISSGSLTTFTPYVHLVAGNTSATDKNFNFDLLQVSEWANPEPTHSATGAEQGRYVSTGSFVSRVLDTGKAGTRAYYANAVSSAAAGTTLTLSARAHDTDVTAASWSTFTAASDPGLTGRYLQYKADFATTEQQYSSYIDSVSFGYAGAPFTPAAAAGVALSSVAIRWDWTDASSGAFQELGTRLRDTGGVILATAPADATSYAENGLAPNTQYQRSLQAFNVFGAAGTGLLSRYTLGRTPSVTADHSTGTWFSGAATFVFTNAAGFGAGGVDHYDYAFDASSSYSFGGGEPAWSAATLSTAPSASGQYYLHARGVNGEGAANGQLDFGPFDYDNQAPTVPAFHSSSESWTFAGVSVDVDLADAGGSGLRRVRHQWTSTTTQPTSGWSVFDNGIPGNSATINRVRFNEGQWYLHVDVLDIAGNETFAYSGPYQIDVTYPTGSITINNGAVATTTTTVTLQLTYADALAGVSSVAYRNAGGAWTPYEAPSASRAWQLDPVIGISTVEYSVLDRAGNESIFQDTIQLLSSATVVSVPNVATTASGDSGPEAVVFKASATLVFGGNGLSGESVDFVFNGATVTATTGASGLATASFSSPAGGTPTIYVNYAGNGTYSAASGSATVTAAARPTGLTVPAATANTSGVFTASATLRDLASGANLNGKSVVLTFQGASSTGTTNASGFVSGNFTAPAAPGSYPIYAQYNGGAANYAALVQVSTLTVALRAAQMIARDVQTSANTVFNSQVTLLAASDGAPLSGRTISFVFQSSTADVTTDAFGNAIATFTAPSTNNLYTYSATFAGDANFAAVSDTRTVAVGFRLTAVVPFNATVLTLDGWTASAKLLDLQAGTPIASSTLTFTFNGSTATGVTNGAGLATANFTAPTSSGAYRLDVVFSSASIYTGSSSTSTIAANPRPVFIQTGSNYCVALNGFSPVATLLDSNFLSGVSGRVLQWDYRGSSGTATTNGSGVAQSPNLGCGGYAGTFMSTITFTGDATYKAITSTIPVGADHRLTVMQPHDQEVYAKLNIPISATLYDFETGIPIATRTVTFSTVWSSGTAVTNASGDAGVILNSTSTPGSYTFSAGFTTDATYYAATATGNLQIDQRPGVLNMSCQNAPVSGPMTCNSVLRDFVDGSLIAGATVAYYFGGSSMTALTDGAGSSTGTFTAPAATGTVSMVGDFQGTQLYYRTTSTGVVSVVLRPTTLNVGAIEAKAGQTFTISATAVENFFTSNAVPGRTVRFDFRGSSQTATTDAFGVSSVTFTAPASTGAFGYSVWFNGDTVYSAAVGGSTVTVTNRDAQLLLSDVNTYVSEPFGATGILRDGSTGISASTVSFVFQGSTVVATTNGIGVSTAAFVAPAATGTYTIYGAYNGSALYNASTTTANIIVDRRPTVLAGQGVTAHVGRPFAAAANLNDFLNGTSLSGKSVKFTFQSSSAAAATDGTGLSSAAFTAPASTGSYQFFGNFAGDSTYAPSYTTTTVTVDVRQVSLIGGALQAAATQPFDATAQLTDIDTGLGVSGATVTFVFQGSTKTAFTDSVGFASATFTAPTSTGTFTYAISYAGTTTYEPKSNNGSVQVKARGSLIIGSNLNVQVNDQILASVTLQDNSDGSALPGRTIVFAFGASSGTAVTNAFGVAQTTFSAKASSGTFTYAATFAGEATYNGASSTSTVTVQRRTTSMVATPASAYYGQGFTAQVTLQDSATGAAVPAAQIGFLYRGSALSATTNALGIATVTYSAPNSTGTTNFSATYNGSTVYQVVSATGTVDVFARPTTLNAGNLTVQLIDPFTVQATLVDQTIGAGIAGRTVVFQFQNSTRTAVTDGVGVATAAYNAPASSGTYTFSSTYAGEVQYQAVSATATVSVGRRNTTLVVANQTYRLNDLITNVATLLDSNNGAPVVGRTVSFLFQGSTVTGTTDASGVASALFPSTGVAGSYGVTATFAGDTSFNASTGNGTISAIKRDATVGTQNTQAYINETFIATGTLTDVSSGQAVTGTVVSFRFQTFFQQGNSGTLGNATTVYFAPASSGTYSYSATLPGSITYNASSATGTVTVLRRPTSLVVPDVSVILSNVFTATATLTDVRAGTRISGATVKFYFQGSTFTATTDGSGVAVSTFAAPASSGTYAVTADYAGTTTYDVVSFAANVNAARRPVTLTGGSVSVAAGNTFGVGTTLADADSGAALGAKPVIFMFNGSSQSVTTNGSGAASYTFTAPASSVTLSYVSVYQGDPTYAPLASTSTVNVVPRPTGLAAVAVNPNASAAFLARATLTDIGTGSPLAGRTVFFQFQGSTVTGTSTDGAGVSSATFFAPASVGNYAYTAWFNETAVYASTANAAAVSVLSFASSVTLQGVTVYVGDVFTASATLTKVADSTVQAGKTLSFLFQAASSSSLTNASGSASATYTAPASAGSYPLQASFGGDSGLASSTNTINVVVNPVPGRLTVGANQTVNALDVFKGTATLTNAISSAAVTGKTISFTFIAQSTSGVTDAVGASTVGFTATSSGTWLYTATWGGDSFVGSVSTQATITVNPRGTSIVALDFTPAVYTLQTFVATATLTDSLTSGPAVNRTVSFAYQGGAPVTAQTNQIGVATFTFNAGAAAGTYNYTATFNADGAYTGSSDPTNSVTVLQRPIVVSTASLTTFANNVFTASATVVDAVSGLPVSGKTVWFNYGGSFQSANTDAQGLAAYTGYNSGAPGAYNLSATMPADATYLANSSTATVTVIGTPVVVSTAAVTVFANNVFIASATVTDATTAAPLSGKTVWFNYGGAFQSGVTNAQGLATYNGYNAGATAGAFTYAASFGGDGSYLANSSTAAVTVQRRPVILSTAAATAVYANNVFTASTTLTDALSGAVLSGKTVSFNYRGTFQTGVTNAAGYAEYPSYNAGSPAASYNLSATFPQDATYAFNSATMTVVVSARPIVLSTATAISVYALDTFIASATFTDALLGTPVNAKTVWFGWKGAFQSGATNASGYAQYNSLNAGAASGAFQMAASFATDGTYAANSSSQNVTVLQRPAIVSTAAVTTVYANDVFTASSTLTDGITGAPVSGKTLGFLYKGSSQPGATNASGYAQYPSYNAGSSSGSYAYSTTFAGDTTYTGNSATATVVVSQRPIVLSTAAVTVYANNIFIASATFTDGLTGAPVSGKTVWFNYGGSFQSGVTNAQGLASYNGYNAGATAGSFSYSASFGADATYLANSATATVTVQTRPVIVSTAAVTVYANNVFIASATLTDGLSGAPISGKTLSFNYGGSFQNSGATNASGYGQYNGYNAGATAGAFSYATTFAGDATYSANSATAAVTVQRRPVIVSTAAATTVYATDVFTASTTLTDALNGATLSGKTISFNYRGTFQSGVTNASGYAQHTPFNAGTPSGSYNLTATFAQDPTYEFNSATMTVNVVARPVVVSTASYPAFYANSVVTASATLVDQLTSAQLSGMTVWFNYKNAAQSAVTDGSGYAAYSSYSLGSSSGVYNLTTTYPGNGTYARNSSTAAITVSPRPTQLDAPANTTVYANDVFTASTTLTDQLGAGAIGGKTISFNYKGSFQNAATNASGYAQYPSYNAGASSGVYSYSMTFAADATYVGTSATATVTVNQRPIVVSTAAITVYANNVFIASATVTDGLTGLAVSGKTVWFNYAGTLQSAATNAQGLAAFNGYNAGATAGAFSVAAACPPDATYLANSSTAPVTVQARPVVVSTAAITVYANNVFVASATLTDALSGAKLSGKTLSFNYQGSFQNGGATDVNGYGQYNGYNAGATAGASSYSTSFAGDATYAANSSTAAVTIDKRPVIVSTTSAVNVSANNVFTASTTLTDALNGAPLNAKTIWFNYQNAAQSGATNASGYAQYPSYNAGAVSGAYNLTATFPGDATYAFNSATTTVSVQRRYVVVSTAAVASYANAVFIASATLTDALSGATISGKTVSFNYFNGGFQSGATAGGTGLASYNGYNAGSAAGGYTYSSSFAGDSTYEANSATAAVTVNKRPVILSTAAVTTVYANDVFTASTTMTDAVSGLPIQGEWVMISYKGSGFLGAGTNASGFMQKNGFNAGASSGAYTYVSVSTGSPTYLANSATATVVVSARPIVLSTAAVTVYANNIFIASATFTDGLTGAAVSGRTVWFNYGGAFQSGVTDAAGLAVYNGYNAGATAGAFSLSASYAADATYQANSATATVTVVRRPVIVSTAAVTAYASSVFIASATLTDGLSGAPVSGKTFSFNYGGSFQNSGATNASGYGQYNGYNAGAAAGAFTYSATFAGDATYAVNSATAAVTVQARPVIVSTAAVSTFVNTVFIASATLTDALSGAPVSGKTLSFSYFNGGAQNSGATNASGFGQYNGYNAGPAGGAFTYSATFAGDATYSANSATAAVSVALRPSIVSTATATSVYALDVFVASATLTDGPSGAGLGSKTVWFSYRGSVQSAATNASGYAQSPAYGAGASSGTYSYSSTFAGDSANAANSSTATVVVSARPILVSTAAVTVYANNVFLASATVTDGLTGLPVSGKTVWFTYGGSIQTAATNAQGLAVYNGYNAGAAAGSFSYSAACPPDATYLANSSTASATVLPRPVIVSTASITAFATDVFTASATVTDGLTGLPIAGKTAWFNYKGVFQSGATNGAGLASSAYNAGTASGTYTLSATLPSDATYAGNSSTATITIVPRPPTLAAAAATTVANGVFTASATLTDSGGIAGRTVWFSFAGASSASVTNPSGLATVTYTAGASSGTFTFSATFPGDATYAFSSSTANVSVAPRPTSIAAVPATVFALEVFTGTATLTDQGSGAPVAGASVQFTYNSGSAFGATDGAGQATAALTAAASSGTYSYAAAFAGNASFSASNITAAVSISPRPTGIQVNGASLFVNDAFVAYATMTDTRAGGAPAAGRVVSFVFNGATVTANTNGSGVATANLTAPALPGSYALVARFDPDATYVTSQASSTIVANTRPTYVALSSATAPALGVVTLSGAIKDAISNAGLPGRTLSFQFQGSTRTATTNGSGLASSTFTAPAVAATYPSSAFWAGDAAYSASSVAASVDVTLRPTSMAATNLTTVANAVFVATGVLTDVASGGAISGVSVAFTFNDGVTNVNNSGVTSALGVANATFTAPAGTGLYAYVAKFNGNSTYDLSQSSGLVQIGLQTTLVASDLSTQVLSVFTVQSKLIDQFSQPISSKTITFVFQGSTTTAQTDVAGIARSTFSAPASSGAYVAQTSYAGDAVYAPSASNANVTVTLRTTTMAAFPTTAPIGSTVTVQAKLTDAASGVGVSTKTVVFTLLGSTRAAVSNASGVAQATFTAISSSGSYAFSAFFAGDNTYQTAADTSTVGVNPVATTMLVFNVSADANDVFTAAGKLVSLADGSGVAGSNISFVFSGSTKTVVTDALGNASTTYAAPAASGSYVLQGAFAGSGSYGASSSLGTVTVSLRSSAMTLPGVATYADAVFLATATLKDVATQGGVAASTVSFVFNGSTRTVLTDGAGVAVASFTAHVATGTYALTASYGGSTAYVSTGAIASVSVALRPVGLTVPPASAATAQIFAASATLVDLVTGLPMGARPVSITFQGSTTTANTDVAGFLGSTFTAPASTGTFPLGATFAGTTVYAYVQTWADVVVSSGGSSSGGSGGGSGGGTVLQISDVLTRTLSVFKATATLTLTSGGTPVTGKTIDLLFQGTTVSVVTDALGVATAAFTAPASSGSYGLSGSYAGDGTFGASAGSATVVVQALATQIGVADVAVSSGAVFLTTATLRIQGSTVTIAGASLSFVFQGATVTATTNAFGVASATFTAPASSGSYVMAVGYGGGASYAASTGFGNVLVDFGLGGGGGSPGPGAGSVAARFNFEDPKARGVINMPFTVGAKLEDLSSGAAVPGRAVVFTFNGSTVSATTDGNGRAAAGFTGASAIGVMYYSAYFAGDSTYTAVSGSHSVVMGLGLYPAEPAVSISTIGVSFSTIAWSTVTVSEAGVDISTEMAGYRVQRSWDLNSSWLDVTGLLSTSTLQLAVPASTVPVYYRVLAETLDYYQSRGSQALKLSNQPDYGRTFLSPDTLAWVEAPAEALKELDPNGAGTRTLKLGTTTAVGFIAAYDLRVYENGQPVSKPFEFRKTYDGLKLYVSIDRAAALSTSGLPATSGARVRDNNQLVLYFFNGVEWVKLGGVNDVRDGVATITVRRTGQFAVAFGPLAGAFSLTKVAPRVFTPEESDVNVNRARWFFENPDLDEVSISIYDMSGAKVRSNVGREGANILFWDGKDDSGAVVRGGAYVYKLVAGGQTKSGVVVVAK